MDEFLSQIKSGANFFRYNKNRNKIFSFSASNCNISINFHHRISPEILNNLYLLAESVSLKDKIYELMSGQPVNWRENRPALHTALRTVQAVPFLDLQITNSILEALQQIRNISEQIRTHQWLGFTGKPIKNIVNIGIGGSDQGPRFCIKALKHLVSSDLKFYFISDADPENFKEALLHLEPETTLFIVASKSFLTHETLLNFNKAKVWLGVQEIESHFIAVTENKEKAASLGIRTIVPIWSWVGGRYSACSAINLITAIAIGYSNFCLFLKGANSMDEHFRNSKFDENLPVLLALLGIWNTTFLKINNLLILTYSTYLEQLVPYIQQLDMESNGKSVNNANKKIKYLTGPIVWGGNGNQAQHSYYQLLCQGTHETAVDLVSINTYDGTLLNQMCLDKIRVLSHGINNIHNPTENINGGVPLNHIQLLDNSPFTIGALIALYEHKIFTQSVIWNINPFDQPGIEIIKKTRSNFEINQEIN